MYQYTLVESAYNTGKKMKRSIREIVNSLHAW